MSEGLRPLKGREGYWLVPSALINASNADELAAIPGLKPNLSGLIGATDAVAAAARILDIEPPSEVMSTKLKLPNAERLRSYQREGVIYIVNRMVKTGGAILADDMGLGKTLQALTAMRTLIEQNDGARIFVLAPAAALETWRDELTKWGFNSFCILSSTRTKKAAKLEAPEAEARIVVTSHDHRMVERAIETAFAEVYPTMLVIDEAHRFRGRSSKRGGLLKDLAPLINFKLAVTGTPQFDRPRDWHQLLHLLFGYRFGNQFDFDKRYCEGHNDGYGWRNKGATNLDELKLRLSYYMLRREKADVAKELPPLTRQIRWVQSTPAAKKAYQRFKMGLDRGTMYAAMEATLLGKTEEALLLAQDARRFLLTTWRKADAAYMHEQLCNRDTPCVLITGEQSTEKRALAVKTARKNGWGIVATIDSTAEALNLQGIAEVGIAHAIDPVPLKMAQMEARLHRLGTSLPVNWYYLAMQDSVDVDLVHIVVNKLDAWVKTMGKEKQAMKEAFDSYVNVSEVTQKAIMKALYDEL